ncbi:ribosomal large subunit pseudouridine synthase [Candidatus Carsonella ruddii CS isolate Thao2000]|uniref:Ribosomal large subunit pseudouridine synthase n=1 Tax=Candidatus Carsonella ruddii CS isolate Thao2000 TaxID=1202537 RepID=J7GWH4_CARRU|nr:pseudouridine synthase [Candidatus Carsonella ruddii]AFP83801.1 ribosomal large subunit pseudouridine synthase [Candidatus Carsonella ruddii CS isolate Thao2000]
MFNFKILYYDKNIIVINKPVGVIFSKLYCCDFIKNKKYLPNKGILNRLDKYTSGIILIAKNITFYFFFKKLLLLRIIKKKYKTFFLSKKKGFINLSLKKKKFVFLKIKEKKSLTYYKIIKKLKKTNFYNVCIKTGRTHQIRIHINHIIFNLKKKILLNYLHYYSIMFYYPFIKKNFNLFCKTSIEFKKNILINI